MRQLRDARIEAAMCFGSRYTVGDSRHGEGPSEAALPAGTNLYDFVDMVTKGTNQKDLKKSASKVYPVRFSEISKIEVLNAPAAS